VNQATTFADLATEAQRQTLTALKQAHDLSLRGAELAVGLVPRDTGTRSVPKDAVEGAFGFAGQVLQQQKAYALRMTEILTGAAAPAPAKTK
jgi:hypothetical protein